MTYCLQNCRLSHFTFKTQMSSSGFLVCAEESHTGRPVSCPMLRKELTSTILPFRQVQPTAGFKVVGATTLTCFVSRGSHINIERGGGCRTVRGSPVLTEYLTQRQAITGC